MGIGTKTLKRAFDTVWARGSITRKELSELICISEVSAGRAIDSLVSAGLLSLSKGIVNGRSTDIISASADRSCLLIDLCEKGVSFSVSSRSEAESDIRSLSFLHMRDADANLSIALSDIVKHIRTNGLRPDTVAVAIPNTAGSPDPKHFTDALSACGLHADIIVSGADAAYKYFESASKKNKSFAFLSIAPVIWGFSSADPSRMLDWGKIKVGAHHGESFESVLSYDTDEEHLKIYLRRVLASLNAVLAPDKIFVASSFLPESVMNVIGELSNAENVSHSNPIMGGLLCLAKDRLFEKFILN